MTSHQVVNENEKYLIQEGIFYDSDFEYLFIIFVYIQ